MKQTSLKSKNKQFSLTEFVWHGFNYTVGIGFIGVCGTLANFGQSGAGANQQVGMNILWILLIEGLIAGSVAWAFAKLSRIYKSSNNGGAYIFVRGTFGKFLGIIVAFMLYICMPFMIAYQIMLLIRGAFAPQFVGASVWWATHWGNFGDLYFDLIGLGIYILSSLVIFGGIKIYRKFALSTSFVKWGTAGFLILAAIVMAFMNGKTNYALWANGNANNHIPKLQLDSVIQCFNTCFFFFCGFEIYATAGKNIQNPNRNLGLGILIVMIASTLTYILIMIIFFGVINPFSDEGFHQNEVMSFWFIFKDIKTVKFLYWLGPIIMIISSIALKINIAMQNSLYGGTVLQPLFVEGYFPNSFGKLNKDGLPIKASALNLCVVVIFAGVWLLVPDLIKGIICTTKGINPYVYHDAFNVGNMAQASSTVCIFVYICVICAILAISVKHNKFRLKIYEDIIFAFVLVFLTFIFIYHYYSLVSNVVEGFTTGDSGMALGGILELGFIIFAVCFSIIWYHTYYKHVYQMRYLKNPKIQTALDKEFELIK